MDLMPHVWLKWTNDGSIDVKRIKRTTIGIAAQQRPKILAPMRTASQLFSLCRKGVPRTAPDDLLMNRLQLRRVCDSV